MSSAFITQPNYVPWYGWFLMVSQADHLVLLDTVQMTRQDWRTRNLILGTRGPTWLSIPVIKSERLSTTIHDTLISPNHRGFPKSHWCKIENAYTHSPYFQETSMLFREFYKTETRAVGLADFTIPILRKVLSICPNSPRISLASEILHDQDRETWLSTEPNERLIKICERTNTSVYLSSTGAKSYLAEHKFAKSGIGVQWIDPLEISLRLKNLGMIDRFSIIHDVSQFGLEAMGLSFAN